MPSTLHFYTKYSKEKIKIDAKPFASGGEGAIYSVVSPRKHKHLVAKIYYPEKRTTEREQKMHYLMLHAPIESSEGIAWVQDVIYKDRRFIGILLHRITGDKLTKLTLSKLPRKARKTWASYAFGQKEALKLRLHACFNLAVIIYQIHLSNRYVLVDLKPDNVLIQPDGSLVVVDMDSVEVIEDGKAIFSAPVATPEYTPPEYYRKTKQDYIHETWDRFSLGIMFYQLLFGLHPFAASCHVPYDHLVGLNDKIQHGLYVHHSAKKALFKIIPPPHLRFKDAPKELQELFQACFVDGHEDPNLRPSALDWSVMLSDLLDVNLPFDLNPTIPFSPSEFYFLPSELLKGRTLSYQLPSFKKRPPIVATLPNYKKNPIHLKTTITSLLKTEYQQYIKEYRPFFSISVLASISFSIILFSCFSPILVLAITFPLFVVLLGLFLSDRAIIDKISHKVNPAILSSFTRDQLGIYKNHALKDDKIERTKKLVNGIISKQKQALMKQIAIIQPQHYHRTYKGSPTIVSYFKKRRVLNVKIRKFQKQVLLLEKELVKTREEEIAAYSKENLQFQKQLQQDKRFQKYTFNSYNQLHRKLKKEVTIQEKHLKLEQFIWFFDKSCEKCSLAL